MKNKAIDLGNRIKRIPSGIITERRQSRRKNVESGVVALTSLDEPIKIGNIIDINEHGLSFMVDADCHLAVGNQVQMDILIIDENIFLEKITASIIVKESLQKFPLIKWHCWGNRIGVRFHPLAGFQERQLRKFISSV